MEQINPSGRAPGVLRVEQMIARVRCGPGGTSEVTPAAVLPGVRCLCGGNSCLSLHRSCSLVSAQGLEKGMHLKASHKLGCEIGRGSLLFLVQG